MSLVRLIKSQTIQNLKKKLKKSTYAEGKTVGIAITAVIFSCDAHLGYADGKTVGIDLCRGRFLPRELCRRPPSA